MASSRHRCSTRSTWRTSPAGSSQPTSQSTANFDTPSTTAWERQAQSSFCAATLPPAILLKKWPSPGR
eukprot:4991882-Ditylum_brightwellii.AAC.1